MGEAEDLTVDPLRILRKVKASFPGSGPVFVTADERTMPVPAEALTERVRRELGLDLVWKSGVAPDLGDLPGLALAQLDFDVACRIPVFAGTTRSTFFNMVGLSRLSAGDAGYGHYEPLTKLPLHRCGQRENSHDREFCEVLYVYNAPGETLRRRTDHGGSALAALATQGAEGANGPEG